ncbi:eukaryotic translation initiation factor 2 subunit alpha [Phtheirospermum japonicum]|uniref:Eukaryotic translation initiation factor 2 subunit alpha n=1 Tax=Phtheirospermum japonicum TaxID=374723 RepID=A0A830DKU7_9LAMI|nr:eukaryotic translation initiation factor 2 subunit alpha [Phtheirospermum japonicum]
MATNGMNLECRMYEAKYPEVDHAVMIQVKSMADSGAYVSLLEYNNIEGMILFSELSRRRIRSISSLIKVGRIEPVMVLRVDKEKGYIDLSKRRVSEEDIQGCEERFNKSKLVHSIMRHVAETLKLDLEDLYIHVGWPLYRKYGHAFEAFKLIVTDPDSVLDSLTREVKEIGPDGQEVTKLVPAITDEVKDSLVKNIRRRMTPQPLKIRADIEMKCFQFDGVLHIKEAMRKAEAAGNADCPVKIKLVAPPAYVLNTQTLDKEQGIAILNNAIEACTKEIERHKGKLTVKEAARAVSEREDKLLAEHMAKLGRENEEISGDEDSEEEEDTGMGDVDLENSRTGITDLLFVNFSGWLKQLHVLWGSELIAIEPEFMGGGTLTIPKV